MFPALTGVMSGSEKRGGKAKSPWGLWAALMLALIVLGLVALVYHLIMAIISRND